MSKVIYKKIDQSTLARLFRDSATLSVLDEGGVSDWEFYDEAFAEANKLEPPYYDYIRQSDENLTQEFDTINDNVLEVEIEQGNYKFNSKTQYELSYDEVKNIQHILKNALLSIESYLDKLNNVN